MPAAPNEVSYQPPPGIPENDPRVQLATERTLLAWLRTGLALMAFGFVVARFALILHTLGIKATPYLTLKATVIGIVMVLSGVTANFCAAWHYRYYFKRIQARGERPFAAPRLAGIFAYASALIGIALAIYLLMVDLTSLDLALPDPGNVPKVK